MKTEEIKNLLGRFESIILLASVKRYLCLRVQSRILTTSCSPVIPATLGIKAKDFAAEMTSVNVQQKDLRGMNSIEREHVDNNLAVRKMLLERGTVPENLPAGEDVKKVQRRLASEEKKMVPKKGETKK